MTTTGLLICLACGVLVAAGAAIRGEAGDDYKIGPVDTAHGDREFRLLWPSGAPGAVGTEAVDSPRITVYRAPAEKAGGAAVVICPGGGYVVVAADHEGKQVAEWLNSIGVTAFVLQYRLGPRYRNPAPLRDSQRALRMVRASAGEWGVDPARVGILGFSAGGHLASSTGTHFDAGNQDAADPIDRHGSRPDFMVLVYPVITFTADVTHRGSRESLLGPDADPKLTASFSNELQVTPETPPTFLVHTSEDDGVPPENSVLFYEALHKAGVPAEMHIFTKGQHGLGLGPKGSGLSQWPALCGAWMGEMGLLRRDR